jgi:hypothetical protein
VSAFQVSTDHIDALIHAAKHHAVHRHDRFAYYFGNPTKRRVVDSDDDVQHVGWVLWNENIRSLNHRYPDGIEPDGGHDMAPKLPAGWLWDRRPYGIRQPTLVESFSLCACYDYQACESADFRSTEAYAVIEAIKEGMIRNLPGYDKAPWEWTYAEPKPVAVPNLDGEIA